MAGQKQTFEVRLMQREGPDWKLLLPPKSGAKCGKPYAKNEFETRWVE